MRYFIDNTGPNRGCPYMHKARLHIAFRHKPDVGPERLYRSRCVWPVQEGYCPKERPRDSPLAHEIIERAEAVREFLTKVITPRRNPAG